MSKFDEAVKETSSHLAEASRLLSFTIRLGDVSEGTNWEFEPDEQFLVTGDSINEFIENLKGEIKRRDGVIGKKVERTIRDNLGQALNAKLQEIMTGIIKNSPKKVQKAILKKK